MICQDIEIFSFQGIITQLIGMPVILSNYNELI